MWYALYHAIGINRGCHFVFVCLCPRHTRESWPEMSLMNWYGSGALLLRSVRQFFLTQSSKMGKLERRISFFTFFTARYIITPADIFARHICSPVFFLFDIYLLSSFTEQANPLIQCWLNRESRPLHRRFVRITYLEQDLILHTHCVRETSLVEPTMWK